ncbi:AraC-like DNA-binding protein [Chryseobacterium sediminis]|uniref:AraC-like DNA-binding protein n=1 Tax=Chryseobacterium sediminis TaxID=1679494 RepID=A0ABR6PWC4_9FLAO|nr:helix-turn-helix transcriptional regulator [Chryseobacterium sediminis]MBB6330020.1 AraC-like DNA-binding protein [Chryseobacterium sediminis]
MNSIINLKSISEIYPFFKLKSSTVHPLIAVIDFSLVKNFIEDYTRVSTNFYCLIFKDTNNSNLKYGRKTVDFQDGSLICLAPNQILELEREGNDDENMSGWGLFIAPSLLNGYTLSKRIIDYSFFEYQTNEALHLSDKEKKILTDCIFNIEKELHTNIDRHSQTLIVSLLEVLLNYCTRFYDRQFITRRSSNEDVVGKFEKLLKDYFKTDLMKTSGLPSVKYFADKVFLSAKYFSDLLKKETGKNAKELIQYQLIEIAKENLLTSDVSVSEIAYDLGFEYPQYFSRLFKLKTGMTPLEFRNSVN